MTTEARSIHCRGCGGLKAGHPNEETLCFNETTARQHLVLLIGLITRTERYKHMAQSQIVKDAETFLDSKNEPPSDVIPKSDGMTGPDVPLVFRVDLHDGRRLWGVAKPTANPQHGRGLVLLGEHAFGWWYSDKTLDESVRDLFHSQSVDAVHVAKLTMEE